MEENDKLMSEKVFEKLSSHDNLLHELLDLVKRKQIDNQSRFTTDEVVTVFKISKRKQQYLRDSGELGYSRAGRRVLYSPQDIETYFQQNQNT
jgi:hypothetical protein